MLNKYRLVHINCPYDCFDKQATQSEFSSMIANRICAYQMRYGPNVFPLGPEDFIGDLFAIKQNDNDKIVASMKFVDSKTCDRFSVVFPLFHTLENQENPQPYYQDVKSHFQAARMADVNIGYFGSLNIDKNFAKNPEGMDFFRKVIPMIGMSVFQLKQCREVWATGTIPNKSNEFVESLGFERHYPEPLIVKDITSTTAYSLRLEKWSDFSVESYHSLKKLWDNRLNLHQTKSEEKISLAA